jgi:putative membrane protein
VIGWSHPDHDVSPALQLLHEWTPDPWVLGSLTLAAGAYACGTGRLWRRAGALEAVRPWQLACFAAGWLSVVLSLMSPLDALSDVSFAAHMTQHELLMLVAAPLLILGRPFVPMLWALPPEMRQAVGRSLRQPTLARTWRWLSGPFMALVIHALAIWIWHVPLLFDAALRNEAIHALQHLCFFVTAALFWWALIHGRYGRAGYGVSVLFVFATALHTSILGALLSLGQTLYYPEQAERARAFGLDPLGDQELAGLIMWVPSGAVFAVLGLALFAAWLGDTERRAERRSVAAGSAPRGEDAA